MCRVNDASKLKREDWDHMIIEPIQFHGHVIRKLSDWCSVVPDFRVDAELPSLEVEIDPGDYSAIFSFMNSLSDGRSTTPPSNKREGEAVGEKGSERKLPVVSSDTKDSTSSDNQKLLMMFRMKEVAIPLYCW